MKKIIICSFIILITLNLNAQSDSKKFFQNWLIGTWTGQIKATSTRALKIVIMAAKYRETGISTITGFSTVNGKNKTNFQITL